MQSISTLISQAESVRYIKLGGGGGRFTFCRTHGVAELGFGLQDLDRYDAFSKGNFEALSTSFANEGGKAMSVANVIGQLKKARVAANTPTIWITFEDGKMWWAVSHAGAAWQLPSQTDAQGLQLSLEQTWSCVDTLGRELRINDLSGDLTQVSQYRGTVCAVKTVEYVKRRLIGEYRNEAIRATAAKTELADSLLPLIQHLNPADFELLVTLVIARSGWQQVSVSGKTMKDIDLELIMPLTGDRGLVQIKSKADSRLIDECFSEMLNWGADYRLFFAYHTWVGNEPETKAVAGKTSGSILGGMQLALSVIEAGLTDWLINKVR